MKHATQKEKEKMIGLTRKKKHSGPKPKDKYIPSLGGLLFGSEIRRATPKGNKPLTYSATNTGLAIRPAVKYFERKKK